MNKTLIAALFAGSTLLGTQVMAEVSDATADRMGNAASADVYRNAFEENESDKKRESKLVQSCGFMGC